VFFPLEGSSVLNMALVYNWAYQTWTVYEIPNVTSAATQYSHTSSGAAWDLDSGQWDADHEPWDTTMASQGFQGSFLMSRAASPAVLYATANNAFEGGPINATLARIGIDASLNQRGDLVHNPARVRMLRSIWPMVEAPVGTPFTIRAGFQDTPFGPVQWTRTATWVAGGTPKVDLYVTGRYLAWEMSETSTVNWRFHSYLLDIVDMAVL
jgi:hypothetical protein